MDKKQILALMKAAIQVENSPKGTFSYNGEQLNKFAINEALRKELKNLSEDNEDSRKKAYRLIEEAVGDLLPQRVQDFYGRFAEVRTFPQSTTAIFTRKLGRVRAKQFVTRVGLAGVYEVFKLGQTQFRVVTSAIGGAYQIGYEEFLDGRADFGEVAQIVMEGMDELISREIAAAMQGSLTQLPAANQISTAGFDPDGMDQLITIASAYGTPTIYCTREFAVKMVPNNSDWISDGMRDTRWSPGAEIPVQRFLRRGSLPAFLPHIGPVRKHTPGFLAVIPQGFQDELNNRKIIDPGYAWVIPSGGDDKPVKVAFEGTLHMRERENEDWSRDVQLYQKVGVGVIMTNNLCSYVDTQLKGKLTW